MNDLESALRYYTDELSYLRRTGGTFARRYPGVASRLELSAGQCADPHVERLIESFAFLTARLQRRMDSQFPEISSALLGLLHPHLVNPVPSLAIACFDVDSERGKLTAGHQIRAGTRLFAQSGTGLTCRFRTSYPVTLWPLAVVDAGFESPAQFDFLDSRPNVASVLRLRLSCLGEPRFEDLALRSLRFYLNGESTLVSRLYDLLFCHELGVAVLPENGRAVFLPQKSVVPVGFELEEAVIPYPTNALPAYRLLQEYFLFPQKFHFFGVDHLETALGGKTMDILILLDRSLDGRLAVDRWTFRLGCTPIINVFSKTSEPIRLDYRQRMSIVSNRTSTVREPLRSIPSKRFLRQRKRAKTTSRSTPSFPTGTAPAAWPGAPTGMAGGFPRRLRTRQALTC